ncbi:MAG: 30S ribosomal protein S8 [SAR324 cluster bacterium]|uniref:Small ribosomal subunit protein uS8 n=1 Tax=SAR324 cluster bacterium TaxID=2024889 RepID=A0A2A4SSL0_9DELT|nr:MAG: 30S ribosomal protein S8 [SAR324 cluster bacterium]
MKLFSNFTSKLISSVHSHKSYAVLPKNLFYFKFLKLLFREGFVSRVILQNSGRVKVYPKYCGKGFCAFHKIKILSTPGKVFYLSYNELTKMGLGTGIIVLSTCKGLLSHHSCLKLKIGGTALCHVC